MDDFDSDYFQPLIESNSNFHFTFTDYNTPLEKQEQTPIETHQTVHEDQDDEREKRDRVDNNIFKTPLSEFRKLIKQFLLRKKMHSQAFNTINKQNRNLSTFPKYWVLCAKLGCKEELKQQFKSGMEESLRKRKCKMSEKRFEQLQKVYKRMLSSLMCTDREEAMREYWGKFRQKSKFMESQEEIGRFQKFLETIK